MVGLPLAIRPATLGGSGVSHCPSGCPEHPAQEYPERIDISPCVRLCVRVAVHNFRRGRACRASEVVCQVVGAAFRHPEVNEDDVVESETVSAPGSVSSFDLKAGDRVLICWSPDRECVIEYLGDGLFRAERTLNSKLKAGDTFFCRRFIKGRPLYVDDLTTRDGVFFESYAMGTEHGLSQVRVL